MSQESIPLAERCGTEKPFPSKRQRKLMQGVSAEDYALIAVQAIMQQATGKITTEFLGRYNRAKGRLPTRRLQECNDYPRDSWPFAQKAIEMVAIIDHNNNVERSGVGEEILVLDFPRQAERKQSSVEEV